MQHLRSHIKWWPQHRLSQVLIAHHLTKPKVCNFSDPIMTQDVGQLQVTMQDLMIKQVMETIYDLAKDFDWLLLSQVASLFDIGIQVTIIAVL